MTDTVKTAFAAYIMELQSGRMAAFRQNLRAAVRGLWLGPEIGYGLDDFYLDMVLSIERGVHQAFMEAFAEYGIEEHEISPTEKGAIFRFMARQRNHIEKFAFDIMESDKASGGKLGPHFARVEMWANRYEEARAIGRIYAAKNGHLKWILGAAEHCPSCLKLAGKVKRGNVWLEHDIHPKHERLECRGYNCKCDLVPTKEPASRGPLPNIP